MLCCPVPLSSTILIYIDVRLSISSVFSFDVSLGFLVLANIIYTSTEKSYYSFPCVFACAVEKFLVTIYSFYVTAILEIGLDFINGISNPTVLWYKMRTVALLMSRCLYRKCFTPWVLGRIHSNVAPSLYSIEPRVIKSGIVRFFSKIFVE